MKEQTGLGSPRALFEVPDSLQRRSCSFDSGAYSEGFLERASLLMQSEDLFQIHFGQFISVYSYFTLLVTQKDLFSCKEEGKCEFAHCRSELVASLSGKGLNSK